MKERPILFSGPMVKAILAGRKTQTRRVVKPQPSADWHPKVGRYHPTVVGRHGEEQPGPEVFGASDENEGRVCPYGEPGDRLWVRESFADLIGTGIEHRDEIQKLRRYAYMADTQKGSYGDECRKDYGVKWVPSIHMPRAACRLVLEVTKVRVERVATISREDEIAEGVAAGTFYDSLWDSLNAKRGYGFHDVNPWVWVVEFRRSEPAMALAA